MTTPNPETIEAVRNLDLDTLFDAAVKFLRERSEEEQFTGNLDDPYEDPIVSMNAILDAIGWPETHETLMLLTLMECLRAHPHIEQHNCDACIEFRWTGD